MKGCKVAGCKVFDVRVLSSMSQDVQSAEIRGEASTTFLFLYPPKALFTFYPFSFMRDFSPIPFQTITEVVLYSMLKIGKRSPLKSINMTVYYLIHNQSVGENRK
jgi:hypothetical protein